MSEHKRSFTAIFRTNYQKNRHLWRLVIISAAWMIFMAITSFSKFYTVLNFQTMGAQFPEYGLMSLGIMVCMMTGGIDLSAVSTANLASITAALLMAKAAGDSGVISGAWLPLLFLIAIIIGALAGGFNGVLISKFKIPPILATLGSGTLITGICTVITNGKAISDFPKDYSYAVNNKILGIPVQALVFIIAAVVIWFLLVKTAYGKKILMLGSSEKAALYSGIKVDLILIKTYIISGVCAALGGMVMLANYSSARADYGTNYTLQCVLIVVLGGVNPNGGKGKISGVVLAILLVRMLETGINRFPSISSYYISLIWGAVLIFVMVLDFFTNRHIKIAFRRRK